MYFIVTGRRKASLPTIGIWSIMTYLRSQESGYLPNQLKTVSKSDKTLTSMFPEELIDMAFVQESKFIHNLVNTAIAKFKAMLDEA